MNYEFDKNIRLILDLRKTYSVFQNDKIDALQNSMLTHIISIVKKIIEGRPTVQYYIQVY